LDIADDDGFVVEVEFDDFDALDPVGFAEVVDGGLEELDEPDLEAAAVDFPDFVNDHVDPLDGLLLALAGAHLRHGRRAPLSRGGSKVTLLQAPHSR
jgi:hypothetical protein